MVSVARYQRCLNGCDLPAGYKSRHITLCEDIDVFDWNSKISSKYPQPLLMSPGMEVRTKRFYEIFQRERDALKDPKHKKPHMDFFKVAVKPEKSSFNISKSYSAAQKQYSFHKYPLLPLTFGRTADIIPSLKSLEGRFNRSMDLRYCR